MEEALQLPPLLVEQLQELQDGYQPQSSGKDSKLQDAEILLVAVELLGEESEEVLSWAIKTAARPGDCIVALHVHTQQLPGPEGKHCPLAWVVWCAQRKGERQKLMPPGSDRAFVWKIAEEAEDRPFRLTRDMAKSALVKMLDPYVGYCVKKQVRASVNSLQLCTRVDRKWCPMAGKGSG